MVTHFYMFVELTKRLENNVENDKKTPVSCDFCKK